MDTVKSRLWIWGHPANSLKGVAGLEKDSFVTPVMGMQQLGTENIFYVPMGRPTDRPAQNAEMKDVRRVGWSMESEKNVLDLIEQKAQFPNLSIAIFDDFFCEENGGANYTRYSVQKMEEMRDKLHAAGMEMWVVFYTRHINDDTWKDYLKVFDGVTYWYWDEPENELFDRQCRWFFDQTQGQKRMIGCYLYNFGKSREATAASVRYQLDRDLAFMRDGTIQGIILHTNAVGGMGFAAYDEAANWAREHGDILVP